MIRLDDMRLVPLDVAGGGGRVARFLGSVLVVSVEAEAVGATALVELCRDHAESSSAPGALIERVTGLLARSPAGSVPAFCLLVQVDGSLRAVVNGSACLTIGADPEPARLVKGEPGSWTTVDIDRSPFISASLQPGALSNVDQLVDLRRGVSLGSGFVLIGAGVAPPAGEPRETAAAPPSAPPAPAPPPPATAAPPVPAPPPPPAPPPVPPLAPPPPAPAPTPPPPPPPSAPPPPASTEAPRAPVFELVDLTPEPVAPSAPAPLPLVGEPVEGDESVRVRGLNCARGHFNDPRAQYCAVCGIQMGQASFVLVEGQRPPLGVLVLDNGESHPLATDLIIGRQPGGDTAIQIGRAKGVIPGGDASGLSRVHAEVRLVDWEVQLIDRQSTNGTFTWDAARSAWQRLAPNTPVILTPGMQVAFGPRTAVYESTLRTG